MRQPVIRDMRGAVRLALLAILGVGLAACGDSTTLTGPDAREAATQFQATLEQEPVAANALEPDALPLVILDGVAVPDDPRVVLRSLEPSDIERISVTKGSCLGVWRFGEAGRNGAIELYTVGFDGEALQHTELPVEERIRCQYERMQQSR